MNSRRIFLLTKGYLSGRLDLRLNNKLSALREDIVLLHLEQELSQHVFEQRAVIMSNFGALGGDNARKNAISASQQAEGYALPYIFKDSSIGDKKFSPSDIQNMKDLLNKAKAKMISNA